MHNRNANRPGYKQIKIGWIPKDWEVKELIHFCINSNRAIVDGPFGSNLKTIHFKTSGIPVINSNFVTNFKFIADKYVYVDNDLFKKEIRSKVEPGDIIMAKIGARCGSSAIMPKGHPISILSGNSLKISINKSNYTEFVWYYLTYYYFRNHLVEVKSVGAQPAISLPQLKSLLIPRPPLPEQRKIAEILSAWDEAIEKAQKLIEAKERRKKGLMQQLLTGRKRLKGFEGKWNTLKMNDLFDRVTRKNSENNRTILTISAQQGFINQEKYFNKVIASESLLNYYLLDKGEFAYNKSYSNGYPMGAIKRLNNFNKGVVTTLYICFNLKPNKNCSSDYFKYFFEKGLLNRGLEKIAHEGGRAHGLLNVTPQDFFELEIVIPKSNEQRAIASVLSAADGELTLLRKQLEALKFQKKGLMQKLLTGEVRVKI